jgi:hypothetical protein
VSPSWSNALGRKSYASPVRMEEFGEPEIVGAWLTGVAGTCDEPPEAALAEFPDEPPPRQPANASPAVIAIAEIRTLQVMVAISPDPSPRIALPRPLWRWARGLAAPSTYRAKATELRGTGHLGAVPKRRHYRTASRSLSACWSPATPLA